MQRFNQGFLLGAATSAHQVEGDNRNSDCWALEHIKHSEYVEPSGMAVDHYHRYAEDIRLLAGAGLNAYRFSIEWARIEPEQGTFDDEAVEHYRQVIKCCERYGVEPIVTLHHFSSPAWLIAQGGWESEKAVDYFVRYVQYVMERLGSSLRYVCTINEANMGLQVTKLAQRYILAARKAAADAQRVGSNMESRVQMGVNLSAMLESQKEAKAEKLAIFGTDTPAGFTMPRSQHSDEIVMRAHEGAAEYIRSCFPGMKVGLTLSLHDIQPVAGAEEQAVGEWDEEFRHYLPWIEHDDFIGVQCYTRTLMGPEGQLPIPDSSRRTQAGYEYYPQAVANVARRVAEDFKGELMITENGIATADDDERIAFIDAALAGVQADIADGVNIVGYMHWSLLDNFEWQKGYAETFGLIAVDRRDMTRMPKPSLAYLGQYAPED